MTDLEQPQLLQVDQLKGGNSTRPVKYAISYVSHGQYSLYGFSGHPNYNKDPYNGYCNPYNGYYKSLWTIGWLAPINGY